MDETFPEIAGFQVVEPIGRGGMGEVFRAQRRRDGKIVALKVIQPSLAHDQDFRLRFERESKVAASISDPHVVEVYESGSDGGTLYISMELVDGTDLQQLIEMSGKLSPRKALSLLKDAASGLDAVHSAGLIHRDIKPANILISPRRPTQAYLTDFGIAKAAAQTTALTSTGHFVGTLDYSAPEQIEGKPIDARADIYALGCVFFHALVGEPPFAGESPSAKLWAHVHHDPPDIAKAQTGDLALLGDVFRRVLSKDPEDRFPSAGDFAVAFEAALDGEAVTRKERFVGVGDAQAAKTRVMSGATRDVAGDENRGRRWIFGAVAAVVALVIVGTGILIASGTPKDSSEAPSARSNGESPASTVIPDNSTSATESTGAVPTEPSPPVGLVPVERTLFSAKVPAAWTPEEIDEENSGRLTNSWQDPSDEYTSVLIDSQRPAPSVSVLASAASVREQTSQSKGYNEISFGETTIAGRPTAEWIFDLPEVRKVDYFFAECDVGVAVLGSAPKSRFGELRTTFRKVAASVDAQCESSSPGSPWSSGWIAQLGSFRNIDKAYDKASEVGSSRDSIDVLRSDDFSELVSGYWVVFAGPYASEAEASAAASQSGVRGAFSRFITRR